ncbi:hypothetical protein NEOLI_004150 [Neolecta irregularis DAH-3]|uniref:Uncharacterized protein n=1 Tax=Neolecta irregularis (strain DAH-3) TaxID=1198029 RepID=A0A1U7LUW7_NEOID|nr:hypothetical protein NEOLI_004150 [Neolecta irregularis DAH-3]|eukprot:OLL26373.1 hypothetical protein NEOLI_004150 [Neolecta irregularis DAH-3]
MIPSPPKKNKNKSTASGDKSEVTESKSGGTKKRKKKGKTAGLAEMLAKSKMQKESAAGKTWKNGRLVNIIM